MTSQFGFTPVPDSRIAKLTLCSAQSVNLRRDLYRFVDFVRSEGLKRSLRGNGISKGPAIKLAKLLSFEPELAEVKEEGSGYWSDKVSRIARQLGLVSFNVEGEYAGHSSHEPSFPDNYVEVDAKRFGAWLAKSPLAKEQAILDALIEMTANEFFHHSTLLGNDDRFDGWGCATGPASRMPLASIRRSLLDMLAELPSDQWIAITDLIEYLKKTAPDLILSPELRKQPTPEWELKRQNRNRNRNRKAEQKLDERYQNFREFTSRRQHSSEGDQLTEDMPDVFRRVEGRYLQYFLQEIPLLCGFVDLVLAGESRTKILPPLDSVVAVRFTQRLRQVRKSDRALDDVAVTVLPNFDVVVEARSWPDRQLDQLAQCCILAKEDSPLYHLRLDRKQVLAKVAAASDPLSIKRSLEQVVTKPLPENVAMELDSWCGHAQKLTVFENVALVELRGGEPKAVRAELGKLVLDDRAERFLITRDAAETLSVLEQRQRVPRVVQHAPNQFGHSDGVFAKPSARAKSAPKAPARKPASLKCANVIGYFSGSVEFMNALEAALAEAGRRQAESVGASSRRVPCSSTSWICPQCARS